MWVVMKVQDWEFEPKKFFNIPISIEVGKCIGYIPVYATKEDAEAEFPDGPFAEIQEVEKVMG